MKKILIIKTSSLGDIVHSYPVLDYLRRKFPLAQIDWVVEKQCAELVQSHPEVNHAISVSTKDWRSSLFCRKTFSEILHFRRRLQKCVYDCVFDLQGNIKSGLILSLVNSPLKVGFGRKTVAELPNILFTNQRVDPPFGKNIRDDYLAIVKSFFSDSSPSIYSQVALTISDIQSANVRLILENPQHEGQLRVVVCPGSAWQNKQLTTESLILFLKELHDYLRCHFLLLFGTTQEKEVVSQIHREFCEDSTIVDRIPLPAVQNLIEASDLMIGVDSLPLHLAGTTSTPSFSIFGPSMAVKYKPIGECHYSFQGKCPYGRTFDKRCPILRTCPTGACIRKLPQTSQLFIEFHEWWEGL